MKYSLEHLGLAAQHPAELAAWYGRVLSTREIWQNGQTPPAVFVELPGGPILEIYPAQRTDAATGDNTTAGWRHLALRVDNLDLAQQVLTSRGVVFTEAIKPAGGGGRVLFFADPEGNLLHLVERPAASPLA